jgi:leucyl-tRNA synthetase
VLHLLYARFWHKVLFDAGYVSAPEPFGKLVHQGMILGEVEYTAYKHSGSFLPRELVSANPDGGFRLKSSGEEVVAVRVPEDAIEKRGANTVLKAQPEITIDARAFKMSKSRGNVINPDDVVKSHGADALRLYEMFLGPLEAVKPWSTGGIQGVARFLDRSWALAQKPMRGGDPEGELLRLMHKTIRKVGEDIEGLRFNTAISALMVYLNELAKADPLPKGAVEVHVRLLHPLAPHLAEELWETLGHRASIQQVPWPAYDPALCVDEAVTVAVQVNGKMRGTVQLAAGSDEADALAEASKLESVQRQLEGKSIRKTIWVKDKLLNLIAG